MVENFLFCYIHYMKLDLDFDIEELKANFFAFFYKFKFRIVVFSSIFIVFAVGLSVYVRNDYYDRIDSSNKLIEYINGENNDFLKKKHGKKYNLVVKFLDNSKNPSKENFEKFSELDTYVFKNLFFFANKLWFFDEGEFDSYYESDKHPWSKLVKCCNVFYGKTESVKLNERDDYLITFLIGKGKKC